MKKTVKVVSSLVLAAVMAFSPATALGAQAKIYRNKRSGECYYVNDKTGKRESGMKKVGKYYYYFDENGDAVSGFVKYKGSWYYFDSSNKYRMKTGWFTGEKLSSGTYDEKYMKKYYFGKDGRMRIGKHTINGKNYDFTISGGLKGENSVDIKDAHDLEKDFFDLTGVLESYEDQDGFFNYLNEHYIGYDTYSPDSARGSAFSMYSGYETMVDAMYQSYNGTDYYLSDVNYYYDNYYYHRYNGQELLYCVPDGKKGSAKNIYRYLRKLLKENGFSEKNVKSTTIEEETSWDGIEITVKYTGFTKGDLEASISYSYYKKLPVGLDGETMKMNAYASINIEPKQ